MVALWKITCFFIYYNQLQIMLTSIREILDFHITFFPTLALFCSCHLYSSWWGLLLLWQNTMTISNLRRKGFISSYNSQVTTPHTWGKSEWNSIKEEVRAGSKAEAEALKPWKSIAYFLVPHGSFRLLSYVSHEQRPRGGTTCSELSPPSPPTLVVN